MVAGYGPPKMPVRQMVILGDKVRRATGLPDIVVTMLLTHTIARFSEPLALTSILPYLPEMIESFGVKKEDVGRWAGICMASFSLAQSFCGIPWGALSDHFGRKPAVVFGLFSTMIGFIIWGFSTNLTMAIAARVFSGMSNGNVGIIRTMVAEMVPWKSLQPTAFAVMPLIWSVGSVFGPTMGGFFANPARRWPSVFGGVQLFEDFPYALPSLIAASIFLLSLASAIFFLEETMESKKHRRDWGIEMGKRFLRAIGAKGAAGDDDDHGCRRHDEEATAPLVHDTMAKPKPKPKPAAKHTVRDVLTPQTVCFLMSYFFLAFHTVACDQILAVFLSQPLVEHTPENTKLPFQFNGGFGFSSDQIGTIFTIYGIIGLTQFLTFPPICKAFGVMRCFQVCSLIHPIYLFIIPYIVLIPNADARWYGLVFIIILKGMVCLVSFPALTILLTNSASSSAVLGTVNGTAVTVAGFGRALGPALSGMMFTMGVYRGYAISSWWFLAAMSLLGAVPAFLVDEPEGFGGKAEDTESASETEDDRDSGVGIPSGSAGSSCDDDDDEERALLAPERKGREQGYGSTA